MACIGNAHCLHKRSGKTTLKNFVKYIIDRNISCVKTSLSLSV